MRGFMLDSARCLENRDYYPRFIRFAAQRGVNTLLWHFTDDQGCSLRFDSVPEAASPHAYTKAELTDLLRLAREHGITVIPELETLGHTRYLTRSVASLSHLAENDDVFTSICPVAPQTRDIISRLIDEVVELFDAPLVHVGLDEVNFGGHPLTRQALQTRAAADLYADYTLFLHSRLAAHGKQMMMWGDHLLRDAAIAPQLPRDIVVCNWQYAPDPPQDTTQRLLDWGFDVVLCPALISYSQPLFPGQSYAIPNLRAIARHAGLTGKGRVLGTLTTIWTPTRFFHDALWLPVDLAAAIMRDGPEVDLRQTAAAFAQDFYGLTPSPRWLDACEEMFQHMPLHKEWIGALRLDEPINEPSQQADRWTRIASVFAEARPQVRREPSSYDALILMLELLAHTFRRAAAAAAGTIDNRLLEADQQMMERLVQTWDRERFADDPRKWEPVFPFDECNHLIAAFRRGSQSLQQQEVSR
ncbi:MAG TPA: family 20 glycosylhydrolase [Phycisphaeraceae bacterium]